MPRQAHDLLDQRSGTPARSGSRMRWANSGICDISCRRPSAKRLCMRLAMWSIWLSGSPSALPTSRMALGVAVLDEVADHRRAARWCRSRRRAGTSRSRASRPKSRSTSGTSLAGRSSLRKRSTARSYLIGSMPERPSRIADQGADGRAAAAHGQVVLVGVAEDVPEAEEEAGALAGLDQRELLLEPGLGRALAVCLSDCPVLLLREVVDGFSQELVGVAAVAGVVVGELVGQVAREVEAATALGDASGVLDRFRQVGEEALHLSRRLEVELGVGAQMRAGLPRGSCDAGRR